MSVCITRAPGPSASRGAGIVSLSCCGTLERILRPHPVATLAPAGVIVPPAPVIALLVAAHLVEFAAFVRGPSLIRALFVPQRLQRIDARCPPRRNKTRRQRHRAQR